MNKKMLVLLPVLTLLASGLAGCGGDNNNKGNQPTEASSDSTETKGTSGTPVTLTVEVFDRGIQGQPDLNNNTWTRYINENFGKANNAVVKFVTVPRSQEIDKLNVMMAADEAPDISFTYDSATVSRYAKINGIMPLDDLLEKYGQDLKNYLGETVLTYGQFNGKQMAIPAKRTSLAWIGSFIRKDWLDKLGLPVPTNRDELYNTLVAFRDQNPGGVDGVIPWGLAATGMNYGTGNLAESFWGEQSEEEFVTSPNWLKPGNKESLKFLNKLYNEKLISPDFALDKTAKQADADVTNGKVGFFSANWDYAFRQNISEPLKANVPEANFVPIDTFKNDEGKYKKMVYNENGVNVFIPKSSKNAELAIKYLNWMANPDVLFFLQYGEEGVNHKMVDGIPQVIAQTGDNMQTSPQNLDYTLVVNGVELGDQEKNIKALSASYSGLEETAVQSYKINTTDGYTAFFYDTPNEANIKFGKTLGDMNKQMTDKLIVCKPSEFDSLYDKLVDEYMAAGGKAVMEENMKIYEAMQANKK
ncbi:putative aldouronate transport system substrate-binding protein [Paenibacillus catalpae]|uniref:Putative aldouronate transport system substrate-binding protein n=1 Tax=Paenibacillus catalpae TaxID=1045775 RepID=A0A1I2BCR6_9BACL|nr:extracellular solute-binding protein [Paenibacillus catalpae]SFE53083.1 putative aldouronate transport system substrate-binding protein [Paenibacillus catalpae]